ERICIMTRKPFIYLSSLILSILLLSGCGSNESQTAATSNSQETSQSTTSSTVDLNEIELPQLDSEVKENEDLVEMETTAGKIKIKLFPEIAPKAVENFMTHAKEGYYKGTPFHRVIEEFMIQGGDPEGTGMGGESIWGEGFEVELSDQLYHIRGALSMARGQALDSQGSQFFIVQNDQDMSKNLAIQFTPEKIIETYKKRGSPCLDGEYTVFGQVTDGMEIVDKIAKAKVEPNAQGESSVPVDPVKIDKITILQEAK